MYSARERNLKEGREKKTKHQKRGKIFKSQFLGYKLKNFPEGV